MLMESFTYLEIAFSPPLPPPLPPPLLPHPGKPFSLPMCPSSTTPYEGRVLGGHQGMISALCA